MDLPFPSRESLEDLEGFLLISFVITIRMIFAKAFVIFEGSASTKPHSTLSIEVTVLAIATG